ncbi:MAG TPA: winged helix-turn-helix domain-containing protein [Candidatus Bathyarchaeia archaeon]|nr:winged helix-turn-helix domain-containing protein [Candidatus Bathyarchaeia archaeon]
MGGTLSDSEEAIYSTMFSSLRHPARRKILRMLSEKPMSFSRMLEELGISSSHLTYHLENLGELVSKAETGEYRLSTFGAAAVDTMRIVEEAPAVRSKQRWFLPFRWKSVLAALVIGLVLVASLFYVQYGALNQLSNEQTQLESKYDQLLSWSSGTNDAIAFLQDVIQIDVTKYHATLLSNTVEVRSDLGGVVEEILRYSLTSSDSKGDVVFRFRNNELSMYQVNLLEGSLVYAQPQSYSVVDAARNLLGRLKAFEGASYFDDMSNMLASVTETENTEITQNNTKLTVSVSGDTTGVQWFYTENGVDFSQKGVYLEYENGVLKELTDGWFLLKIGSTQVNVSSDQAIEFARSAVKGFTWKAEDGTAVSTFTVLDTPVSVVFHPTQREEYLTLVPYWYVTLYLDKVYPGGVNRIGVGVWADTGKVADIKTLSG